MPRHLGDYAPATVIRGKFTTYQPSTGAPFALAGTPALSVYKDDSITQSTTGVTLTASFDSVTGLNHYTIDTSTDGSFYSAGSNFDIVITTGTVDSVSVVGSVISSFSLAKANVATLTANSITAAAIAADAITAAKIADGAIDAATFAAGAITAAVIATNAIDADALAADAITEIQAGLATGANLISEINAVQADIAALNDISPAEVNAEIVDALAVDTYAEPTGVPPATDTIVGKLGRLHMESRNRVDVTATKKTVYDDGGAPEWEYDVSDDGTTASKSEANAI